MDSSTLYELIGYLASALVVVSLLMSSVLRLRIIGFLGAVVFTTYGVLIDAIPIVITNVSIVLVHGFHLRRLLRDRATDSYFEVVRWPTTGVYLPRFLAFHAADIRRSQPSFSGLKDDHLAWMVLRDTVPVGVLLARREGPGLAHIDLDYVTPEHRDFAAGSAIFGASEVFPREGIARVRTRGDTELHRRYLSRMGFEPADPETELWEREVA